MKSLVPEAVSGRSLSHDDWPFWLRYSLTLLIVALATVGRAVFFHYGATGVHYITFYPAVFIAAFFLGQGPGFLAVALSVPAAMYWIPPVGSLSIFAPAEMIGLGVFVVLSSFIVRLCERERQADRRALTAEKALSESQLRERDEWMRYIIQHDPNAIAVLDRDLRHMFVSDRFLRDYNVKEPDVIGKSHYEVFPEIPEKWKAVHRRCLEGFVQQDVDDRFERPDGSITYTRWECRPWLRGTGEIGGIVLYTEVITEQKLAERALRESAERLSLAQQAGHVGVFDWNFITNDVVWTPELEEIFGLPRETFENRYEGWRNRVYPDDLPRIEAQFADWLQSDRDEDKWEYRFLCQGEVRWISARGRVIRDGAGKPIRMVGTNLDITERKEAEEAVRSSEEKFAVAFAQNPAAIAITRLDGGRFIEVNDTWTALTGYSRDEIIGTSAEKLPIWPTAEARDRFVRELRTKGSLHGWDQEFRKKSGEVFTAEISAQVLTIEGEKAILSTLVDITERKRTEAALRDQAELLEIAHDAIIVLNLDCTISFWNHGAEEIYGYSKEEALGKVSYELLQTVFPQPRAELEKTLLTKGHWEGELFHTARNGTRIVAASRWVLQRDSKGNPVHMMEINNDITERRNAETAILDAKQVAEQANKAKDIFISALSHELRPPLTPVLLTASALENDSVLDVEARSQISLIKHNIEMEAHLIDDLLDVSRIASGKISLRPHDIDLNEVLSRAVEVARGDIDRNRLAIQIKNDAECSRANVDPVRIQQVFWNLIKNAAKFTPLNGSIDVRVFNPEPDVLCVEVRDTGIGIAPEHLEKIFAPFEQGANSDNHRFGGLGLGLAISKTIVELHGGTISASSAGLNQGATFQVRLPACKKSETAPVADTTVVTHPAPRIANLHILLVEDDENTRRVISRLLTRDGHNVEAVGTCLAATHTAKGVEAGEIEPFNVLISDIGLPDGSGLTVAREIRAMNPEIRAVAVSGYGTEEDIRNSKEAGFNTHLIKPISIEALRRALAA